MYNWLDREKNKFQFGTTFEKEKYKKKFVFNSQLTTLMQMNERKKNIESVRVCEIDRLVECFTEKHSTFTFFSTNR
jgi:hypothetical protein